MIDDLVGVHGCAVDGAELDDRARHVLPRRNPARYVHDAEVRRSRERAETAQGRIATERIDFRGAGLQASWHLGCTHEAPQQRLG
jgi:hypothetical protein